MAASLALRPLPVFGFSESRSLELRPGAAFVSAKTVFGPKAP